MNSHTTSSAPSTAATAATRNGNECLQYILVNEGDVDIRPVLSKTPIVTSVTSHSKPIKNHYNKHSAQFEHHHLLHHHSSIGSNQNLAPSSIMSTITSTSNTTAASTSTQPSILKPKPSQLHDTRNSQPSFDLSNYSFISLNSPTGKPTPNGSIRRLSTKDVRNGKGLRHFAMKVCEKVKQKGVTTYNIVADELVSEITAEALASKTAFGESFDQKNIRRRVYDALNVLMAMNIISKDKKEIRWHGLPTNAVQECYDLEREKEERLKRIEVKKKQLRELLIQHIAFKNLVERNKCFVQQPSRNAIITLPFIIVNTNKETVIDCSISNDKSEYLFNFDNTFEIHDDIEVLKKMGLAANLDKAQLVPVDREDLDKARRLLPEALRSELDDMIEEKQSADF